ncbi:MAG: HlyD family secretion protein [Saprospiraceae bacterium]
MAKRKGRNTFIFILVGIVIALIVLVAVQQRMKPKGEKVFVEKAERRMIKEIVAASGKVFPQTEVKISSDVSGEVVELYVEEGDSVVSGQLLAKIDPDAYESQVERGLAGVNSSKAQMANAYSQIEASKAQREQIEAQLINAKEIHKRNDKLKKEGVISEADFEASLASVRQLEANLRAAAANIRSGEESAKAAKFSVESSVAGLKELQTSLRRTTIYAPMNGIVSALNVEKGERVVGTIQMTGTELMRIANLNAMEIRVDVSENDIPRVAIGDEAEIEVDAYIGRKFKGRVTQIASSATGSGLTAAASLTSDQVINFEVRISMDPTSYQDLLTKGRKHPFHPGMSASVEINTEVIKDALSIPIQSVTTRDEKTGKAKKVSTKSEEEEESMAVSKEKEEDTSKDLKEVVFIVSADTVRMVEVKTGIQDDTYIQVLTGVSEGDEIVKGPYTVVSRVLKQGEKVIKTKEDDFFKKDEKE